MDKLLKRFYLRAKIFTEPPLSSGIHRPEISATFKAVRPETNSFEAADHAVPIMQLHPDSRFACVLSNPLVGRAVLRDVNTLITNRGAVNVYARDLDKLAYAVQVALRILVKVIVNAHSDAVLTETRKPILQMECIAAGLANNLNGDNRFCESRSSPAITVQ